MFQEFEEMTEAYHTCLALDCLLLARGFLKSSCLRLGQSDMPLASIPKESYSFVGALGLKQACMLVRLLLSFPEAVVS